MSFDFETVDVFTDRRFAGNPLAVVTNAQELDREQMQAIAAEFNLAETTFVLPPKEPSHAAEVRIFTPRSELPFAGHPNLGTAFVLAARGHSYGRAIADPLVFEQRAGLVAIEVLRDGGLIAGARLKAPQLLARGEDVGTDIVAAACSIEADDVATAHHTPCICTCGVPFVLAELATGAALSAARPNADVFSQHLKAERTTGVLLYVRDGRDGVDLQARMFAPLYGVPEDPATGSAGVALVGLLASLRGEPDLRLDLCIAQGIDMGRPSRLEAAAEKKGGRITGLWIGGRCISVMRGVIEA